MMLKPKMKPAPRLNTEICQSGVVGLHTLNSTIGRELWSAFGPHNRNGNSGFTNQFHSGIGSGRFEAQPDQETEVLVEVENSLDFPWSVILFNDDEHSIDEVAIQIQKAIDCGPQKAEALTLEVHHNGKATIFEGSLDRSLVVKSVLDEIDLITEIRG